MLIEEIAQKQYLTSPNSFAQNTSCKPIDFPHKGKYFFLDNSRENNFPGFETEKTICVFGHEPVNKGGPTAGIAYNKDRLFYFVFSITRKKEIIEQKTDSVEELDGGEKNKEAEYLKEPLKGKRRWCVFSFTYRQMS